MTESFQLFFNYSLSIRCNFLDDFRKKNFHQIASVRFTRRFYSVPRNNGKQPLNKTFYSSLKIYKLNSKN